MRLEGLPPYPSCVSYSLGCEGCENLKCMAKFMLGMDNMHTLQPQQKDFGTRTGPKIFPLSNVISHKMAATTTGISNSIQRTVKAGSEYPKMPTHHIPLLQYLQIRFSLMSRRLHFSFLTNISRRFLAGANLQGKPAAYWVTPTAWRDPISNSMACEK